jgi:ATP-dependent Lon protease
LIPEANAKDLQDIPENVKNGLEIVPVRWIDQVLDLALESKPVALPEDEAVAIAPVVPAVASTELQGSVKH